MAKAVKTAIIAAFVVVAGAYIAGITPFAAPLGFTAAKTLAVTTFATTFVAAGIGQLTSKGIDASGANFGTKFATRNSSAPRQIVYGKTRVGGTIVHIETAGTDNHMLHMIVAVAGHEVEAIETVRLNDIDLTSTTSTINGETVHTVTNADYTNTDNGFAFTSGRLIRFTKNLGTDDQTADNFAVQSLAATSGSITSNHRFRGIAYVYMQLVFDAEKFGGGLPAVSFIVKGKKVFDPRNSQTAWSDNPALCIRDYLTDTRYGLKATSTEINDTTSAGGFASAANICDQTVTLSDSSTETRYTANGFTNMSANGEGVLEALLSSCGGKMSYTNGKFNLFAGTGQTPSLTITDDDLLEPVAISTKPQTGDMYNTVKGIYVDASSDYQGTESPVYQDSTFLSADTPTSESSANYVKTLEVQFPFTTSETMAQRLQRITLNANRQTTQINLLTTTKFMRLQPNDWVYVTNDRLGYSSKVFEVVSMNLEVIGEDVPTVATRLVLKEASNTVFSFASNSYESPVSEGSAISTGTYGITAPSGLSATITTNNSFSVNTKNVVLSWTNNDNQVVNGTEIQYKLSSDSTYIDAAIVARDITKYTIIGLEVGKTYNIRIRHISTFNTYSAYATVNASTGGTAYTALEDGATVGAKLGTNLKDSSNNTLGDSDVITNQGTAQNITNQGNLATLDTVNTAQLVDDAITNAKIATNAITGDVLAANAITENKLATNAVTADKINANAVTSAKIAANAITAAKIAAGTITATEIASNTITSSQINVGTLAVQHFDDVSADIKSHLTTETFVPLEVFGSVFQRGSTDFTTNTNSTGTYLSLNIGSVRDGAKYRAIWSGVYGDCTGGVLEYSLDNSTFVQAAGGIQNVEFDAGTFRTYVFVYNGTISGLTGTTSNVYWRVRWITKLNSTYQSLYVFIDNTQ